MSDARWSDVESQAGSAIEHASRLVLLFEDGGFEGPSLAAYRARMGFMHAAQAAHTSLEATLLRVLDLLGEERPTGAEWHMDLIARVCRDLDGPKARPPILSRELCNAADETRRFRNLAAHGYDTFDWLKAKDTVESAKIVATRFLSEIRAFAAAIDGS